MDSRFPPNNGWNAQWNRTQFLVVIVRFTPRTIHMAFHFGIYIGEILCKNWSHEGMHHCLGTNFDLYLYNCEIVSRQLA
jgi:hypothetical protein